MRMIDPEASVSVYVELMAPEAQVPSKSDRTDAGWDLYLSRDTVIGPRGEADIHTDIAIALPPGWYGQIVPRSSTLRKYGLDVVVGVIDCGYRGELFIQTRNLMETKISLLAGTRIAQLLILPVPQVEWIRSNSLPESKRGARGFGSTGE